LSHLLRDSAARGLRSRKSRARIRLSPRRSPSQSAAGARIGRPDQSMGNAASLLASRQRALDLALHRTVERRQERFPEFPFRPDVPEDPMRHLLAAADLSKEEIQKLLSLARSFSKSPETPALLQGKTIVNLFFENSTRTRMSFEVATRRL